MKMMLRVFLFMLGLFFMGLGISLITKSNLGTSPISSVPYELSLIFPITIGEFTILLSLLFIIMQMLILRKEFPKEQMLQVFVGPFFGIFIDVGMYLFRFLNPDYYGDKILVLLLGCVVLALGIYFEVAANVLVNPGEGIVKAIAIKIRKEFGIIKVIFDASLFLIAAVISLTAFGTINGLGVGTIVSALIVGYLIRFYGFFFKWLISFTPLPALK
ncbi:MAG: putative rane protein [Firmicutes bacterium]|nr:putative rane protein [Bacillota bacterium]